MMAFLRSVSLWICTGCLCVGWLSPVVGQTTNQPRVRPGANAGRPATQQVQRQLAQQQNQQAGGRIVDARAQGRPARNPAGPPKEFQLTPAQRNRIDQMLEFWEKKTSSIDTLSAKFGRWVYDPVFGPKDKNQAAKFSTGEIRYAAVDKGMIREDRVYEYDPTKADQKNKFKPSDDPGEHWVCTGTSVFEYDHKAKKLNEIRLPKGMQGKAIADGPLPFMFGAKAETIKKRYWIREIPQKAAGAPYHLEFLPRLAGENYSRIQIKLDAKKFLPTEMVLYELNRLGRSAYAFKDMQANAAQDKVTRFLDRFIAPKVPRGYKLIVHDPPEAGRVAEKNPSKQR